MFEFHGQESAIHTEYPESRLETLIEEVVSNFQQQRSAAQTTAQRKDAAEAAIKQLERSLPKDTFTFLFPVKDVRPHDQRTYQVWFEQTETDFGWLPHPKMEMFATMRLRDSDAKKIDKAWKVEVKGRLGLSNRRAADRKYEMIFHETGYKDYRIVLDNPSIKLLKPE